MRCECCKYSYFDYGENYDYCWLGIESYDNGKTCGCKYNMKTLNKWAEHQEQAQDEEYKRMGEYFSQLEDLEQ